jgi:hypothetical protein
LGSEFVGEAQPSAQDRALAILRAAAKKGNNPQLSFIALALNGKKIGFEKVVGASKTCPYPPRVCPRGVQPCFHHKSMQMKDMLQY